MQELVSRRDLSLSRQKAEYLVSLRSYCSGKVSFFSGKAREASLCPEVQTLPFSQCIRCMKGSTEVSGFILCVLNHICKGVEFGIYLFFIMWAKSMLTGCISAIKV